MKADQWRKAGSRLGGLFGPAWAIHRLMPQAAAAVAHLLDHASLESVPASAVIVFTNPKVVLHVEGCSSTVTRLKDLKDVLRRMAGKGQSVALPRARVREVQKVFDDRMLAANAWR